MNTDLDPEQLTAQRLSSADSAFASAEGRTFRGEPLKPFTIRRQFAAQALGNKLLCGCAKLEAVPCKCGGIHPACELCHGSGETSGAYDGMFIDAAVVIYLCRCPRSEVELAARRPDKVLNAALDWAENIGMAIGSETFNEACEIYADILRELQEAQFKITKSREGSGSKNA